MVEDAQGQKAPSQQFVDRFSRYYAPAVILAACLVAILPPLVLKQPFNHWFYQALGMLLVACPCALVISTPVAIVSAIGSAARQGVLIKGGVYLEEMGEITAIAFDKTGTLTRGEPELTDLIALHGSEEEALSLAAAIERRSEHPLAQAIVNYAQKQAVPLLEMQNFQAVAGRGAYADLAGQRYYIGNLRFFEEQQRSLLNEARQTAEKLQNEGKTVMLMGDEQRLLAMLAVADVLRENSAAQIGSLKRLGMKKVIMLTGDNERTARAIANKAEVDEYRAGLLPEDKLNVIKDLLEQDHKVVMVGDGVNDAPALAMATVGIAMGAAGTDTALETADIALMADDLSKVAYTIDLGRRTLNIIKQNIAFSLLVKASVLLMVIPGWLTLWLAVLGDMGTSLLVTLNGMRLLSSKHKNF